MMYIKHHRKVAGAASVSPFLSLSHQQIRRKPVPRPYTLDSSQQCSIKVVRLLFESPFPGSVVDGDGHLLGLTKRPVETSITHRYVSLVNAALRQSRVTVW